MPAASDPTASRRVDFYVLDSREPRERLRLACRLCEKAFAAGQRVLVWVADAAALASVDELLWTFADRSFVPHEPYQHDSQWQDSAVLLSCEAQPAQAVEVLLNLTDTVPRCADQAQRIIEVIDAEPERRASARQRFRDYRERGLNPQTHHIAADETG